MFDKRTVYTIPHMAIVKWGSQIFNSMNRQPGVPGLHSIRDYLRSSCTRLCRRLSCPILLFPSHRMHIRMRSIFPLRSVAEIDPRCLRCKFHDANKALAGL